MALFQEHGIAISDTEYQMRAFDATVVCESESGRTGSQWRLHYSIALPSFGRDFFKLTPSKGQGTGESFKHFPIHSGDHILADRGYSTATGIEHVDNAGSYATVRVNTGILHFEEKPERYPSTCYLRYIPSHVLGQLGKWYVNVKIKTASGVPERICALRKTEEAAQKALKHIDQTARRNGTRHWI